MPYRNITTSGYVALQKLYEAWAKYRRVHCRGIQHFILPMLKHETRLYLVEFHRIFVEFCPIMGRLQPARLLILSWIANYFLRGILPLSFNQCRSAYVGNCCTAPYQVQPLSGIQVESWVQQFVGYNVECLDRGRACPTPKAECTHMRHTSLVRDKYIIRVFSFTSPLVGLAHTQPLVYRLHSALPLLASPFSPAKGGERGPLRIDNS